LIELEHNYRTLPVGICFYDTELRCIRINEKLAEIDGFPVADHIGKTVEEIVPELAPALRPIFEQVLATGKPVLNNEIHGATLKDPNIGRDWLVNYHPYFSPKNDIIGITVVVQEITVLKQTEKSLKESEERYRSIFENSDDSIFTVDKKGKVIELNHSIQGVPKQDLIGKRIVDLVQDEADKQKIRNTLNKVFNNKESVNYETGFMVNNKRSYYSTTMSPTVVDGKVKKAIAISRDITSQKEAEKEVEKLVSVIQSSKDFIGIAGLDGKAQLLNSAGKKLVGIDSDKILNQPR